MQCSKCNGTGRVEILDNYFECCGCLAGTKEEYVDLTQRKVSLGLEIAGISVKLKRLREIISKSK